MAPPPTVAACALLPPPPAQRRASLLAILVLAACCCLPLAAAQAGDASNVTLDLPPNFNIDGRPVMTPTRAPKSSVAGRDVLYEVPQAPIGILALFHGCTHNAEDFWYQQEACPECRGLPGEVSHTKQALARGYAVIAINSLDRGADPESETAKCFSYSADKDGVVEALRSLISDLELDGLPLYMAGISSGASFAQKLVNEMPGEIKGVISEVLAVDPNRDSFDFDVWPPLAFIAMEKDAGINDRIKRNQAALRGGGVPAQTIHVPERAVYPTFFSDQASDITPELSVKVQAALTQIGVLDSDGWLIADPRRGFQFDWRAQLREMVPELDGSDATFSVTADESVVSEALNTAFSQHEVVGDFTTAALAWFEGGASGDLGELVQEYVIRKPALLKADRQQPWEKPATAGDPPAGLEDGAVYVS